MRCVWGEGFGLREAGRKLRAVPISSGPIGQEGETAAGRARPGGNRFSPIINQ